MLNTVCLVGRIASEITKVKIKKEEFLSFYISVTRQVKNEDGIYECDVLPVEVHFTNTKQILDYLNKGDLVGFKGRLAYKNDKLVIYCEKLTFLSSKCGDENEAN